MSARENPVPPFSHTPAADSGRSHVDAIIRHAPDIFTVVTPDGTIRYESPAVERVLGYRPADLIGQNVFDLFHPDERSAVTAAFAEALRSPATDPVVTFRCRHRDGSWRRLEARCTNLLDDPGVAGILVCSRDVTPGPEPAAAPGRGGWRSRASVARAGDAACLLDPDGKVAEATPAAEDLLGRPTAGIIGTSVAAHAHPDDRGRAETFVGAVLVGSGARTTTTLRVGPRGDSWRLVEAEASNLVENPAVGGIVVTLRDLTDRTRAEETRSLLATVVDAADDAILSRTLDGIVLSWNPGAERLYGYSPEEIVGRPISCLIPPDLSDELPSIDDRLRRGERVEAIETVRLRKDGRPVTVSLSVSPIVDADGTIFAAVSIARDVTEAKRIREELARAHDELERRVAARTEELSAANARLETQLAERERVEGELVRLAAIVESSNDAIVGKTLAGIITSWNPAAERLYGYAAPEVVGRPISILVPPERPDEVPAILAQVAAGGRIDHYETERETKDGDRVRVSLTVSPVKDADGRVVGASAIARDVTERKRAEAALRASETRLRTLVEQLPAVIYVIALDAAGATPAVRYVSPQVETMLGYPPEEWRATPGFWARILHPDDRERALAAAARAEAAGAPIRQEYRLLARDGRAVWVRDESVLVRAAADGPRHRQGVMLDVTERREAEAALQERDERLRLALEAVGMGTWDLDLRTGEVTCSATATAHLGLPPGTERFSYAASLDRLHPEDRERLARAGRRAIEEGVDYEVEYRLVLPDGSTRWLAERGQVAERDGTGAALSLRGVVTDVTERKRAEEERGALRAAEHEQARREAELADLKDDFTAIVAHELASPLAALRNWTDILAMEELPREVQAHTLATIRAETDLLTALVADVRGIATIERDDFAVQPRPVPVSDIVAAAAGFNRSIPGQHPLLTVLATSEDVRADPERIGQVLRNLIGNAAKYSPDGTPIELRAFPRGDRIRIEVADRGPGIHPGDIDAIFEKFRRGRDADGHRVPGTGIGLYVCRRIVNAHGGELTVQSEPGKGATFGFDLEVVS